MITLKKYPYKRRLIVIISALFLLSIIIFRDSNHNHFSASYSNQTKVPDNHFSVSKIGKIPMFFEPNIGQIDDQVKFLSHGFGYSLFLTQYEAILKLHTEKPTGKNHNSNVKNILSENNREDANFSILKIKFIGSNPDPKIIGKEKLKGRSNYILGKDSKNWWTDIPNYAEIQYKDIYSGIDLIYYGNQQQLEYDFIVKPGTDPEVIKLGFEGAQDISFDKGGNLILRTMSGDEVLLKFPNIYQERNNKRITIDGNYELDNELLVSFNVDSYDKSKPLVIDPELVYSTYLGGSEGESGFGIVTDINGDIYITGSTISLDFPTKSSYQSSFNGGTSNGDVFITKMNSEGTQIIYSTYLGGSKWEYPKKIGVDSDGFAVVAGETVSENFPVFAAVQPTIADSTDIFLFYGDAFVTKLNQQGNGLVFSTYLGSWERDATIDMTVTPNGQTYVTGFTNSSYFDDKHNTIFPLTPGSYKDFISEVEEIFVTAFTSSGSLLFSTLLGESTYYFNGIAVNSDGNSYILKNDYTETCPNGEISIIILNKTGSALVDSLVICASGKAMGIDLDSKDNIYITGDTYLTQVVGSFPITKNAFQSSYGGGYQDAFVMKLNPQGTILFSSYLGGNEYDEAKDIIIGEDDMIYLTGLTYSADFPTRNAFQNEFGGGKSDAFFSQIDLSKTGTESLVYSTFIGGSKDDDGTGIAVDVNGNAYITGSTESSDFPVRNAFQTSLNGPGDAFIVCVGVSGINDLIYDKVVIGGPSVFPPLLPPSTQQILPQFLLNQNDTLLFTFEGRQTDSRVGLRVINTRFGFAPLYLDLAVYDPDLVYVPPFAIHNVGIGNAGMQFDVIKDGTYTIKVWAKSDSPGPWPSPFQIHLAGNVGAPLKRIFPPTGPPYIDSLRATRQDILFNHSAPRPQILLGNGKIHETEVKVAQTALFKFTNLSLVSQNAVAVLIPTTDLGFPQGTAPIRAIDPNPIKDITTPTARTPQTTNPQKGTVIDFTQVPVPASLIITPQLGVAAVLGIRDQISTSLPINTNSGEIYTIILDMGSGQEIVDGDGNDFRIYSSEGSYDVAVSNTPFQDTFLPVGSNLSGDNDFELSNSGLTSARYVRITAVPSALVDAILALNVFTDEVRENIGALSKVNYTTITMRRSKAPETPIDPFLELIAPDGARMGANESGFGDNLTSELSDAALIKMELNQEGFYRFLGRGYDVRPDDESIGSFYVRLESGGNYDQTEIVISEEDEETTIPQKEGIINSKRQRNSYLFQASPGQLINIVVNAKDSSLNTMLELYDPEDFLIGANDDAPGRSRNSVLSISLPTKSIVGQTELPNPSTYRIVVSAIDDIGSRSPLIDIFSYFRIAANGEYELKVFTGALKEGQQSIPSIFSLAPNTSVQGVTNLDVIIEGENFVNGATVIFESGGIIVNNVNVINSKQIKVNIDISSTAPIGWQDVTVQNPDGKSETANNIFQVVESLGYIELTWVAPTAWEEMAPPTNLIALFTDSNADNNKIIRLTKDVQKLERMASLSKTKHNVNTSLHKLEISEIEPNNNLSQAQVLTGQQYITVNGNAEIDDVGQFVIEDFQDDIEDLYKVTIYQDGLQVYLDGFTSDCDLYVLDSLGDIIDYSAFTGATEPEQFSDEYLLSGSYFIGISIYDPKPMGNDTTPYILTLEGQFEGTGGPNLISYNIYRSNVTNAISTGSKVGTASAAITTYIDAAPFVGEFYYQVTAVYDQGESIPSNDASIKIVNIEDEKTLDTPEEFKMYQNYPNPFNPVTTVKYAIPQKSIVTLKVFDLLGREIWTLVNNEQQIGNYELKFDGSELTSGIYFYRLQAGDFIETKKMVLIK